MIHQNKLLLQLSLVTLVVLLFYPISTLPAQTVPEIAEKVLAATVYLEMKDSTGETLGFGSGFFVKPNLIATNYHVIAGAANGTAKLVGKYTTYKIEGFTATDEANDLALLKVSAYGIKPLPLGNSDVVKIGETVYVAGNPKGLEGTFSDGIISSHRDKYTKERFQMTAPISPGSSGGPVLNSKGEVIGVSVAAHRDLDAQNLNFAIPSRYLKNLLTLSKPAKPLSQANQTISADTYFRRGYACYNLGLYDLAIANYDKAIQLEPNAASAYINRGVVKADLGQHFAAISDYDKAIQLKPDAADAYYNRGNAKGKLGQHFAAISDYDKAIQLKPTLAEAYINRGVVKADLGQHFAAISDYDKAIQLKPDAADAYYNRGFAKADLGQHFAAISDYDKAIQLKPNDAEAYIIRGIAKISLNRTSEAKQDIRTALRLAEKVGDMDTRARAEKVLGLLE